jgi:hypothetical protein
MPARLLDRQETQDKQKKKKVRGFPLFLSVCKEKERPRHLDLLIVRQLTHATPRATIGRWLIVDELTTTEAWTCWLAVAGWPPSFIICCVLQEVDACGLASSSLLRSSATWKWW